MTTPELFLYLLRCELNGIRPEPGSISPETLTELFALSRKHRLDAITAYALERAGIVDPRFTEAKYRAIYKNAQLLTAGNQVCAFLEEAGIRHMPLKGMLLQALYTEPGMRQMTDCDILFDEAAQETVNEWFLQNGYRGEINSSQRHISYFREPVLNMEMHLTLFRRYAGWLSDNAALWKRVLLCEGCAHRYAFSTADEYLYLAAHACRHLDTKGTGIRSLADLYLYRKAHAAELTGETIRQRLTEAGIEGEASRLDALAMRIFSPEGGEQALTPDEQALLERMLDSGAYGSMEGKTRRQLEAMQKEKTEIRAGTKLRYILRRLFPTKRQFPEENTYYYRHPILLPVFWVRRVVRALRRPSKELKQELRFLFRRNG